MTLSSQTPSLHVSLFDGAARGTAPNALSEFRVRQLLPQLQAIHDKITGIAGRFVHLVSSETAPDAATQERLAALLTYGDPYQGPLDGEVIVVTPRLVAPLRPEQVRLPTDRIEDPRAIDVLIDGEGYRPKALKPVPGTAAPADAPAQEKEKGYEF